MLVRREKCNKKYLVMQVVCAILTTSVAATRCVLIDKGACGEISSMYCNN